MSKAMNMGALVLLLTISTACNEEPLSMEKSSSMPALQANVSGSPGDREAIQEIVATFDRAWGSDPVAYGGQYASVIEWVGPNGAIMTDPAAITALYTFLFSGPLAGTTRTSSIRNITFLTGTIAVLDIDTQVTGGNVVRERNVLVKRAGEWRIVLHQQTFVTP